MDDTSSLQDRFAAARARVKARDRVERENGIQRVQDELRRRERTSLLNAALTTARLERDRNVAIARAAERNVLELEGAEVAPEVAIAIEVGWEEDHRVFTHTEAIVGRLIYEAAVRDLTARAWKDLTAASQVRWIRAGRAAIAYLEGQADE